MYLVIARYNENISWAENLDKTVIQKGIDMPNIGREPASYLLFILKNYEKLDGEYVFCQGNPFDHDKYFLESIKNNNYFGNYHTSDLNGCNDHCGLRIDLFMDEMGLQKTNSIEFKAGCQFKLTAEQIKLYPYEFYAKMFYLLLKGDNPYIFERLPKILWKDLK